MAEQRQLVVVRGGGDLATGIVWRLTRSGWPVIVTELASPLTVRRSVSLSAAVTEGEVSIEGMVGRQCSIADAAELAASGVVPVVVAPDLPDVPGCAIGAVVDARLAKRNLDTTLADAPIVVAVGPGFTVDLDCHAVVETQRGHRLGRVLWQGSAAPNTGTPGLVEGRGRERVLRAASDGVVRWQAAIGDHVYADQLLGTVADEAIHAPFDGVARGLILEGSTVVAGLKIGDVDPRVDPAMCWEISDKALAVGGGVTEALAWLSR